MWVLLRLLSGMRALRCLEPRPARIGAGEECPFGAAGTHAARRLSAVDLRSVSTHAGGAWHAMAQAQHRR